MKKALKLNFLSMLIGLCGFGSIVRAGQEELKPLSLASGLDYAHMLGTYRKTANIGIVSGRAHVKAQHQSSLREVEGYIEPAYGKLFLHITKVMPLACVPVSVHQAKFNQTLATITNEQKISTTSTSLPSLSSNSPAK